MTRQILCVVFLAMSLLGCTHVTYKDVSYTRFLTNVGELRVIKEGENVVVEVKAVEDKASEVLLRALDKVP